MSNFEDEDDVWNKNVESDDKTKECKEDLLSQAMQKIRVRDRRCLLHDTTTMATCGYVKACALYLRKHVIERYLKRTCDIATSLTHVNAASRGRTWGDRNALGAHDTVVFQLYTSEWTMKTSQDV